MATLIKPDGTIHEVQPMNKQDFQLREIQQNVEGYFEIIHLPEDKLMLVNEEGLLKQLQYNLIASMIAGQDIVGNALVCSSSEVK